MARNLEGAGVDSAALSSSLRKNINALCFFIAFAFIYRELFCSDLLMNVANYSLTTVEPIIFFLVTSILYASRQDETRMNALLVIGWGLIASLAFSLLRGVLINAFAALFASRLLICTPLFVLLGALVYHKPAAIDIFVKMIKIAAWPLCVLLLSRLIVGAPTNQCVETDGRPLLNYGAFLLGISAVLYISAGIRYKSGSLDICIGLSMFMLCILSRQGTVMIAILCAIATVLVGETGRALAMRWVIAMIGGILAAIGALASDNIVSILQTSQLSSDFLSDRGQTYRLRTIIWDSFLEVFRNRSITDKLTGFPIGQKEKLFISEWNGTYWNNSLHSAYFEQLDHFGIIGLILLVSIFAFVLIRVASARGGVSLFADRTLSGAAIVGITLALAILGYSYDLRNESSAFLFLIVAGALALSTSTAPRGAARIVMRVPRPVRAR